MAEFGVIYPPYLQKENTSNMKNFTKFNKMKFMLMKYKKRIEYFFLKLTAMLSQKPLVVKLIQKVRIFFKHCTLHGFYYLYNARHWTVYTIWCIIIASSVILCTYLSHMIWIKYSTDPTFTVVSSTRYSIFNIPFPTVVLCDPEPVYGPNTKNITFILQKRGYNASQISGFYNSFTSTRRSDFKIQPDIKKMHNVLQDLGYSYFDLVDILHKPCDVLLVKCMWRSKTYDCSQMFTTIHSYAGICCQFKIDDFSRFVDNLTIMQSGVSVSEALDISVNGQKVYHSGNATDGYLMMYVVNHNDYVTFVHNIITLTPGGFFDVNVHVWAIDSSDEVQSLDLKSRKCLLDSDPVPQPHFYEGCVARLMIKKAINHCRCIPFRDVTVINNNRDKAMCTWERMNCFYTTLAKSQASYQNVIPENMCIKKCEYIKYDTETEYLKGQRNTDSNTSMTRVSVHFDANTCMKYRREVLYTWDQMLANLGGIFGLCLGGSIISIIEFAWFIFDLISTVIKSVRKSRKVRNNIDKKQIFTLPHKDLATKTFGRGKRGNGKYRFVH